MEVVGKSSRVGPLLAISVDRVSKKDASAKQTKNCRDCFNHLTHPILLGTSDSRRLFHDRFINPT
jgi:hypothetical protein